MMGFEKRWARAVLSSFAPGRSAGASEQALAPKRGEVDYLSTLLRLMRESTPQAALGLRAAIWMAALSPLWLWGRIATVSRLAAERRPVLLQELLRHRSFVVRELTLLLKFCAAMALLGSPELRERSGYDSPLSESDSGLRSRLPVIVEPGPVRVWPANDGVAREVALEQDGSSSEARGAKA
jgi:hypothetical protein